MFGVWLLQPAADRRSGSASHSHTLPRRALGAEAGDLVQEDAAGQLWGLEADLGLGGSGGGHRDHRGEEGRGGGPGLLLDDRDDPVVGAEGGVPLQEDGGHEAGLLDPRPVVS